MKFNKDLATIHAYLCADGYVIKNPKTQKHKYYHIGLRNTNENLLLDFQTRFRNTFGLEPHICKDGRCRIQNKEIYNFLTSEFSYYSHEWKMPKLSKRNRSVWLRAFFDCESWVFVKKRQDRRIGMDSVNKKGLLYIKKALETYGINSKVHTTKRNVYRLYIYGKNNLVKFRKNIGFLHSDKKKKLKAAIDSYPKYEWIFPKNPSKKFVAQLIKTRGKLKQPCTLRFNSILRKNIARLSVLLYKLFKIKSKIYKRKNKHSEYYELAVYGKQNIELLKGG
jgi:hypothetical protein